MDVHLIPQSRLSTPQRNSSTPQGNPTSLQPSAATSQPSSEVHSQSSSPSEPAQQSFTVATINVNGIRAAVKPRSADNPGMLAWLQQTPADIVLMQEVRADEAQTRAALAPALDAGWYLAQAPAETKGRAGVAILSRTELQDIHIGFSTDRHGTTYAGAEEFDGSGRYIEATVNSHIASLGNVRIASLYLPSGSAHTEKQDEKYRFLDAFTPYLHAQAQQPMLIGGDWNICHRRADLKNWRTNRTKSGFLPAERAFMDHLLGVWPDQSTQVGDPEDTGRTGNPGGSPDDFYGAVNYTPSTHTTQRHHQEPPTNPQWFDIHRRLNPQTQDQFSWWTYRGQAFDTNAGWRIDLQIATHALLNHAREAWIDKAPAYDQRWSDHSPVLVRYI